MKNLTAILLDEADVKDASAVMTSLSDEASEAALTAPIVVFRGQIVKNRFGSLPAAHASAAAPGAIGTAFAGGVYAGVLRGLDGQPDSHLILIDGAATGVTWADAVAFAASVGGELPTRREQRLLFANLQDQFDPAWYWSGEQHEAGADFAWGQYFGNGYQLGDRKSYAGRARAVRRLPI